MPDNITTSVRPADQAKRPRLLLFRSSRGPLPAAVRQRRKRQVRCLSVDFTVRVIEGSCDFDRECSLFEPDMVLLESGDHVGDREYRNVHAHSSLPRLGLLDCEPFSLARTVFMADMDRWGLSDFCTPSVAMAEYFPEIASQLFVWADGVDPADYPTPVPGSPRIAESRTIPVLLAGSEAPQYPWRIRMHEMLAGALPTLALPDLDRGEDSVVSPRGVDLDMMLRATWFVPLCGSIARDVTHDHFRIPAMHACLVSEPTASLASAGMVDMENCVLADTKDGADKLAYLLARKELLVDIINAGHALVMERHALRQRDQVLQWYWLRTGGGRSGRIVQEGPFGNLRLVSPHSSERTRHIISGGVDRALLRQANAAIRAGRLADAEILARRCLNYHFMPEAVLRLAQCALKAGRAAEGELWLSRSLAPVLGPYQALTPDPVEWAYFIRAALCRGDWRVAMNRARAYSGLRHAELDRMRAALDAGPAPPPAATERERPSLHLVTALTDDRWLAALQSELRVCGQGELAMTIAARAAPRLGEGGPAEAHAELPEKRHAPGPLQGIAAFGHRAGMELAAARRRLGSLAHGAGDRRRPAGFLVELRELACRAEVRRVLVCGADPGGRILAVLAEASRRNVAGPLSLALVPEVIEPSGAPDGDLAGNAALAGEASMVVVSAHGAPDIAWVARRAPVFVLIEAVDQPAGSMLLHALWNSGRYHMRASDPEGHGFAVLERRPNGNFADAGGELADRDWAKHPDRPALGPSKSEECA